MVPTWTLLLLVLASADGENLQQFTKLGTSENQTACRKTDGSNPEIGNGYWQATGITTAEQCATLCLGGLNDCRGFEYENMTGNFGRCEIWVEDVIGQNVGHGNPLYCYNRTNPQNNTAVQQMVSLTLNFTGLSSSTINDTIVDAMAQAIKTIFSTQLSDLANRTDVNISETDVSFILMSCETVAIVITKPAGTNLLPIYESLSYYDNSADNPNQGSKRKFLRSAMKAQLAPYGLDFPPNENNPRAIGHISVPVTASACTVAAPDAISAAQTERMGVLAMLVLTVLLGVQ